MASIHQAFGDAQTTIGCLAGGVAGASSDAIGTMLISRVAPASSPGIGALGLEFCARAVVSAAVFGAVHNYMPETSGNVFFTFLYFTCDRGLLSSGVGLARAAVNAATGTFRNLAPAPGRNSVPTGGSGSSTVPPANPTAILTGCGTKSCGTAM